MNFQKTSFVKSITRLDQRPLPELPEFVFAGRSNVGKSSLMNAIFNNSKLVKTSSTPGKTQTINYFLVDNQAYFVDLPGYGYAKRSQKDQLAWKQAIEPFIEKNQSIKMIFVLVDIRHEIQVLDLELIQWLNYLKKSYIILLTKSDKLSRHQARLQTDYFIHTIPDGTIYPVSIKDPASIQRLRENVLSI
jgi:GTP-binding protein